MSPKNCTLLMPWLIFHLDSGAGGTCDSLARSASASASTCSASFCVTKPFLMNKSSNGSDVLVLDESAPHPKVAALMTPIMIILASQLAPRLALMTRMRQKCCRFNASNLWRDGYNAVTNHRVFTANLQPSG